MTRIHDARRLAGWLFATLLLCGCTYVPTYESTEDPAYRPSLQAGNNGLRYIDGQLFYLYVPQAVLDDPSSGRILVTVHAYNGRLDSYNGERIVRQTGLRWAALAEQNGWVVLSPQFDQDRFGDEYQALNLDGELRADRRLHELVALAGELLPGISIDRFRLFGFSGGAQFVHRYAMLHPARVERAVAAGADWYTFPDPDLPYPLGVSDGSLPADLDFDADAFNAVPLLLLAGETDGSESAFPRDTARDGRRYDLVELQGATRVERAQNWADSIAAIDTETESRLRFEILPATGHFINESLRERTRAFLTD